MSKISRQFFGEANKYMRIIEANRDQLSDPNKIRVGQVLKIPQGWARLLGAQDAYTHRLS